MEDSQVKIGMKVRIRKESRFFGQIEGDLVIVEESYRFDGERAWHVSFAKNGVPTNRVYRSKDLEAVFTADQEHSETIETSLSKMLEGIDLLSCMVPHGN